MRLFFLLLLTHDFSICLRFSKRHSSKRYFSNRGINTLSQREFSQKIYIYFHKPGGGLIIGGRLHTPYTRIFKKHFGPGTFKHFDNFWNYHIFCHRKISPLASSWRSCKRSPCPSCWKFSSFFRRSPQLY